MGLLYDVVQDVTRYLDGETVSIDSVPEFNLQHIDTSDSNSTEATYE